MTSRYCDSQFCDIVGIHLRDEFCPDPKLDQLWAAAPDLLAAAKALVAHDISIPFDNGGIALLALKAAIAKAEGVKRGES